MRTRECMFVFASAEARGEGDAGSEDGDEWVVDRPPEQVKDQVGLIRCDVMCCNVM